MPRTYGADASDGKGKVPEKPSIGAPLGQKKAQGSAEIIDSFDSVGNIDKPAFAPSCPKKVPPLLSDSPPSIRIYG